jgi:5-methyltetrahydrofolate--homocysteine methyltransferase
LCLADYIAPESSGLIDYIGAFVVTAAFNKAFPEEYTDDDYSVIMLRILSDRFAEAAAEYLHEMIRKTYWGYTPEEEMGIDDLLKGKYSGIRPAPGYRHVPITQKKGYF